MARKGRPSSLSEFTSPAKTCECQGKNERGTQEFLCHKPAIWGTMCDTLDCAFLVAALTFATSWCRNCMFRKEPTTLLPKSAHENNYYEDATTTLIVHTWWPTWHITSYKLGHENEFWEENTLRENKLEKRMSTDSNRTANEYFFIRITSKIADIDKTN